MTVKAEDVGRVADLTMELDALQKRRKVLSSKYSYSLRVEVVADVNHVSQKVDILWEKIGLASKASDRQLDAELAAIVLCKLVEAIDQRVRQIVAALADLGLEVKP